MRTIKSLVIILLPITIFFGLRLVGTYIFTVKRHSFAFDLLIASGVQDAMKRRVEQYAFAQPSLMPELCQQLSKEFPCVKEVHVQFVAPGVMHLDVIAHRPLFAINHEYIVAGNGCIVAQQLFSTHATKFLSGIDVIGFNPSDVFQCQALVQARATLALLCKKFRVEWQDEYTIMLHEKMNNDFSIVSCATNLSDADKLARCLNLTSEHTRGIQGTGCASRKRIIADMRFSKQIVVFST